MFKILFWNVGCNVTAIFIIKDIHLYEVVLIAKKNDTGQPTILKETRLRVLVPTLSSVPQVPLGLSHLSL